MENDYSETYAPFAQLSTFRILFAVEGHWRHKFPPNGCENSSFEWKT